MAKTKDKAELLQGTLDLLVLKAVQIEPQHGFGIAQRIQQLSSDVLRIEQGSLYPALYRLEERGWIAAEWRSTEHNRRAKYYELTRSGRKQLETEEACWARLSGAVNQVLALAGGRS
jgi:PadR family transcriptional regulator PadR